MSVVRDLNSIVEGPRQAVFSTTLSGEILHWNVGAEQLFGYKAGEIAEVLKIVPPHKAEENRHLLSQVSQGKVLPHIETERMHKNGGLLNMILTLLPLKDANGKVNGAITIATDITESKRIEQELCERNQELSALEVITDEINKYLDLQMVLKKIVDLAGGLVNAKYTSIVIVDEQGGLKTSVENFQGIHPLHVRARRTGVTRKILASSEPELIDEVKPDGKTNPSLVAAGIKSYVGVPIKFDTEVLGVLFAHSDVVRAFSDRHLKVLATFAGQAAITIRNARLYQDLKMQVRKLEDTQAQLTHAEKLAAIGRLAANVAHEINNPLTGILMASSALAEEINESDPKRSELEIIKKESLRARGIIRNLLDFARPTEAAVVETDINELVRGSVSLLRHTMDMKGMELVERYGSEVPRLLVDRNQMMQVFYNLIANALDAMPRGGKLTITTGVKDESVVIEFRDTGVGIPPEHMDKIFEPFFTTKPNAKGTGLGLSVSYNIVKAFGGTIEVKSEMGKGSTFTVCLPIVKQVENG
ncbi:MAG: PAS domain S-box protein [Chloroflexi bacterium]|nr:PAS domain S-box protein [Chloroflexota bacterium]